MASLGLPGSGAALGMVWLRFAMRRPPVLSSESIEEVYATCRKARTLGASLRRCKTKAMPAKRRIGMI